MSTFRTSAALRRSGAAAVLVLLCLPLAACGDEPSTGPGDPGESASATDPTSPSDQASASEPSDPEDSEAEDPSASATPLQQSGPVEVTGNAGVQDAVVVSGSEVGGEVSPLAFPLETRQERRDFGAAFGGGFSGEVTRAVRSLAAPDGTLPWGTVVAVGCEGPTSVRIDAGEAGFEVTPQLPESTVQCLVPVTYVVVFAAPAAA